MASISSFPLQSFWFWGLQHSQNLHHSSLNSIDSYQSMNSGHKKNEKVFGPTKGGKEFAKTSSLIYYFVSLHPQVYLGGSEVPPYSRISRFVSNICTVCENPSSCHFKCRQISHPGVFESKTVFHFIVGDPDFRLRR